MALKRVKSFLLFLFLTLSSIWTCLAADTAPPDLPFGWASVAHNASLLLGTYRPNLYFGTRSRTANTALTGLMWFGLGDYNGARNIRHACEQGDNLAKYGWQKHDGRTFGIQEVSDLQNNLLLTTSFVKGSGSAEKGNWALRLSGTSQGDRSTPISLMFYTAVDGDEAGEVELRSVEESTPAKVVIDGRVPREANFSLFVIENNVGQNSPSWRYLGQQVPSRSAWDVKDRLTQVLFTEARSKIDPNATSHPHPAVLFQLPNTAAPNSDVMVLQKILEPPFEIDIVFMSREEDLPAKSSDAAAFAKEAFSKRLPADERSFDDRFEEVFGLGEAGLGKKHVKMGQFALSNMIGALGYFHGSGLQKDSSPMGFHETKAQVLFTAVPSRPFFPRGFFWDEGFHQMLIRRWDNDLSLDVLQHWFNLLDENGWIAREQILGAEARSKVPTEFQVQDSTFANPPTWLFPIISFVRELGESSSAGHSAGMPEMAIADDPKVLRRRLLDDTTAARIFLEGAYEKLKAHYSWMRRTQRGRTVETFTECEGFRWQGRTVNHTLTSGLDDFPRANPPDEGELHVDLLAWIGLYAKTLASIAAKLDRDEDQKDFLSQFERVQNTLEKLHWNEDQSFYQDVVLSPEGQRTFIGRIGYVGLLPVILGVVPTCTPRVEAVLDILRDPDHLWSDYGLMSLSASDDDFGGGENYWKGPIWINVNYLALMALKNEYSSCPGSLGSEAKRIYGELRHNVVENVYKEYRRTGYIWEQYSPLDGTGQRSHPFTGWSSLVLLMMAEIF